MMIQKMPRAESEDNLTMTPRTDQTPRSKLNSDGMTSDGQSPNSNLYDDSPLGSKTGSKCDDEFLEHDQRSTDDDDEDGDNAYVEEDYYAFLREMAGSFEATREEDESDVGSEAGSSDEDEDDQAVGRKRSSTLSSVDDAPGNSLQASSPPFVGRGRAQGAGSPEEEEFAKANGGLAGQCMPAQPSSGYPANNTSRFGGPRQERMGAFPATPAAPSKEVEQHVLRASSDSRGPVVDDYDVVKAVNEFAKQRSSLSRLERQREDISDAIKLRRDQAENLMAVSRKTITDPDLRSHYVRIRAELLAEARAFEDQLKVLDEAPYLSAAGCSLAEAAFGGHGQSLGVAVN